MDYLPNTTSSVERFSRGVAQLASASALGTGAQNPFNPPKSLSFSNNDLIGFRRAFLPLENVPTCDFSHVVTSLGTPGPLPDGRIRGLFLSALTQPPSLLNGESERGVARNSLNRGEVNMGWEPNPSGTVREIASKSPAGKGVSWDMNIEHNGTKSDAPRGNAPSRLLWQFD